MQKNDTIDEEIINRILQSRMANCELGNIHKNRDVSKKKKKVRREISKGIIISTTAYLRKTWSKSEQYKRGGRGNELLENYVWTYQNGQSEK